MAPLKYFFYPSHRTTPVSTKPVLFYHMPKCGGMTIYALASAAWKMMCQFDNMAPPVIDRCDDPAAEYNLRNSIYTFIAAHLPYGLHNRLSGSPMLMTVLRDPVRRICSSYGYHCMREGQKTDIPGMLAFATNEKNSNLMTKLLSGNSPEDEVTKHDLALTIERLSNEFDFVSTTPDIPTLCESFLKHFGLPNVVTTRINPTPAEFKLDIEGLEEEIRSKNELDNLLFQTFSKRPLKLPSTDSKDSEGSLHPLTVLLKECGDHESSRFWGTLIQTERLFTENLISKCGSPNSDAIDHLIDSIR